MILGKPMGFVLGETTGFLGKPNFEKHPDVTPKERGSTSKYLWKLKGFPTGRIVKIIHFLIYFLTYMYCFMYLYIVAHTFPYLPPISPWPHSPCHRRRPPAPRRPSAWSLARSNAWHPPPRPHASASGFRGNGAWKFGTVERGKRWENNWKPKKLKFTQN